jgi:S-adenosylmethionine decarboxylase
MVDVNVYQENIFHTKMLLKEFDLKHYMFHKPEDLSEGKVITDLLWKEMRNLLRTQYSGRVTPYRLALSLTFRRLYQRRATDCAFSSA